MVRRCLVRPMVPISLSFFLAVLFFNTGPAAAQPYAIVIYGGCSQLKFPYGSPYHSALTSIFNAILTSTPLSHYNSFSVASPDSPAAPISAIYQCRGDLTTPACVDCIRRSINQIVTTLCPAATGAVLQLEGCFLRYDNFPGFVGSPDKTFKAKKCGWPGSIYPGMAERRDSVLTTVATSLGSFRQAQAEEVNGMAQCTGDLTASDCDDCVKAAGDTLRGVCPADSMGSVYLGKCYARFDAAGPPSPIGGSKDNIQSGNVWSKYGLYIGLPALIIFLISLALFLSGTYKKDSFSGLEAFFKKKFKRKKKKPVIPQVHEIGSHEGDQRDEDAEYEKEYEELNQDNNENQGDKKNEGNGNFTPTSSGYAEDKNVKKDDQVKPIFPSTSFRFAQDQNVKKDNQVKPMFPPTSYRYAEDKNAKFSQTSFSYAHEDYNDPTKQGSVGHFQPRSFGHAEDQNEIEDDDEIEEIEDDPGLVRHAPPTSFGEDDKKNEPVRPGSVVKFPPVSFGANYPPPSFRS